MGGVNSGEVIQLDRNGRPYAKMFSLRTHQEDGKTVVHLNDGDYCASEDLAKRQQVSSNESMGKGVRFGSPCILL